MQAHNLSKSNNKKAKRIGRGGKRGSYSGRGIKGQKSRAGRKIRPQIRDIIKKIHKRRGYGRNRSRSVNPANLKPQVVNLGDLEKKFSALGGSASGGKDIIHITPQILVEAGLIKKTQGNKMPKVKILGAGKPARPAGGLTKKLSFDKNLIMSESVKKHVEQI